MSLFTIFTNLNYSIWNKICLTMEKNVDGYSYTFDRLRIIELNT